jgi:large subunit ribosomal protein L24
MATRIRRNDEVIIIAGKDKGKHGRVKQVLSNGKVLIDGINLVKKHCKPSPSLNISGGIREQEAAIQISNVALFNTVTGKPDRTGFRFEEGKKVRFFKSNGKNVK